MGSGVYLGAGTRWGESAPLLNQTFFFELPELPGSSEHKRKYGLEVTFLFATDFAIIANSC